MAFKTSQAKFTSAKKYQTAVRLWAKATMLGLETGSLAAARCADRMLVAIRLMVVPSGTSKGKFWIDVQSIDEQANKMAYLPGYNADSWKLVTAADVLFSCK